MSDIHANMPALEAVLADARAAQAQQFICAGDVVGFGPHAKACVDAVRGLFQVVVAGNHDRALGAAEDPRPTPRLADLARATEEHARSQLPPLDLAWLRGLGHEAGLYLSGRELYVVHGSPSDPLYRGILPDDDPQRVRTAFMTIDCDYVVLGHTHVPMLLRGVVENATVINPGSVGLPLDGDPRASYALLDIDDGKVHPRRVPYDVEATVADTDHLRPGERDLYAHLLRHGRTS
jgi:predicted phosphodiesterase